MAKKPIKVGVWEGGGPPPGYEWHVWVLDIAYEEARDFLSKEQYEHLAMQFKELASEIDPTHSVTLSVDAIDDFHELRENGGLLGNINVRVFFYIDKPHAAIVVLGAMKKQNNGATPKGDRIRMARRLRKYLRGEFGAPQT